MKTSACGTFVSLSMPYISSTPDRLVDDNIILEVKCPYVCHDKVISEVTAPYLRNVNGEFYLDQNHDYYYHVQGKCFVVTVNCAILLYILLRILSSSK